MFDRVFDNSWQGVGISSDPSIKRDFISLYMLAYLKYGSESSAQHLVIVGDMMQHHNYVAIHDMSRREARRLASKKGKKKAHDIKKLCGTYSFNNIEIVRFEDVEKNVASLRNDIVDIVSSDNEIRELLTIQIPQRLSVQAHSLIELSQYTIDELSMALFLGGVRISHPCQKSVDDLALRLHAKGIGKDISFAYSPLGLEFDPRTGLNVEPYSSINPAQRVLTTDDEKEFFLKIKSMKKSSLEKVTDNLRMVWDGKVSELNKFYQEIVYPGYRVLRATPTLIRECVTSGVGLLTLFTALTVFGQIEYTRQKPQMEKDYTTMSYNDFRVKYEIVGGLISGYLPHAKDFPPK
ncbi:MAG: hypothetical protein WC916_02515 [Candidatus Woesearchaeota archaeon]